MKIISALISSLLLLPIVTSLHAEEKGTEQTTPFNSFTGKITRNKVRMRATSGYDSAVIKEFNKGDMVIVMGETDEFYAVKPPAGVLGYVFRTYVLDNQVEGTRVNVRLKPDTEAPVLAQLNSGDRVQGVVSTVNNKWLEIPLPSSVRFYISKDYVEKIGDAGMLARVEKRKNDVNQLLSTTEATANAEMQKPFDQINLDSVKTNYQNIILDYSDFPEATQKAKEQLARLKDVYTTKNIAYLETQAHHSSKSLENQNQQLTGEIESYKNKIAALENQLSAPAISPAAAALDAPKPVALPINMSMWIPVEENLFKTWSLQSGKYNPADFYAEQAANATKLKGIIDVYNRPVKNKPGDYMLLHPVSRLPIAFLYSTHVNLQQFVGHELIIEVSPRSNNHFAFPAYFVLSID